MCQKKQHIENSKIYTTIPSKIGTLSKKYMIYEKQHHPTQAKNDKDHTNEIQMNRTSTTKMNTIS